MFKTLNKAINYRKNPCWETKGISTVLLLLHGWGFTYSVKPKLTVQPRNLFLVSANTFFRRALSLRVATSFRTRPHHPLSLSFSIMSTRAVYYHAGRETGLRPRAPECSVYNRSRIEIERNFAFRVRAALGITFWNQFPFPLPAQRSPAARPELVQNIINSLSLLHYLTDAVVTYFSSADRILHRSMRDCPTMPRRCWQFFI